MDDRKRQIEELEKKQRENKAALDALYERFGESFLGRIREGMTGEDAVAGELAEYRRLLKVIADSETAIQVVEDQIRRFRELEENIELKEREDGKQLKELAFVYGKLGKVLLHDESGAYTVFTSPFREQTDALVTKVRSLEDRVAELEKKDGGNVFTWIGKNAQGLVLRSFLTKAQDSLEQLYQTAGDRYCRSNGDYDTADSGSGIGALLSEVENAKAVSRVLSNELVTLRDEKRKISGSFGIEGSPLKQIQNLKQQIAQAREKLAILYRHFGAEAAALSPAVEGSSPAEGSALAEISALAEKDSSRKIFIDSLLSADDQLALDAIAHKRHEISSADSTIAKLRASLAIDEEQAKIEKYRKGIEAKRARIAEAEKDIAEFEESIKDSEKYIVDLQKLL